MKKREKISMGNIKL